MAEVIVFEDHAPSRAEIITELEAHNHTVAAQANSLQTAYDVLGRIISPDVTNVEDRRLLYASALILDGTLSTMASLSGPRPDFTGPYVGPEIDPELMELVPADSPTITQRLFGRFRKTLPPPAEPTETVINRNDYSSDGACIAGIITRYGLDLPIIGMSSDPLRLQGVEIAPEYDLTKSGMSQLGPIVTAVAEERARRRQQQAIRDAAERIRVKRSNVTRKTTHPEQ